jgi:hypothetical protein
MNVIPRFHKLQSQHFGIVRHFHRLAFLRLIGMVVLMNEFSTEWDLFDAEDDE